MVIDSRVVSAPSSARSSAPFSTQSSDRRHAPADVLTLLMPAWAFLRDDIGTLLLAPGDRRAGGWLGVLLVPESSWTPAELAVAARYVKKRADMAAVVLQREAPPGLALASVPPEAALGTLSTTLRWCPAGGTVVLAWPGSTESGLAVLGKARQRVLAAEPRRGMPADQRA
jgi:hypothetical protein